MKVLYRIITVFTIFSAVFIRMADAQTAPQIQEVPEWVIELNKPDPDPEKVISLYEAYYRENVFVKNFYTQQYKRWLRGIAREINRTKEEDRTYLRKTKESRQLRNAQWSCIGPYDWDHDAAGRSYAPGSAHVYTVEQSVSQPDVLYAGTATTGLWKSTDRGLQWQPLTYDLLVSQVYAIEIDYTDPDVVYVSMFNSVYKTTDGGSTFNPTGDNTFRNLNLFVKDIRMHPTNTQMVFACTDNGLYRTSDSGQNWTQVQSGDFLEVEFHPTNPNTIYATRKSGDNTQFFRSVNGGTSFSITGTGWPVVTGSDHQRRTEIAVSPDLPNNVFALCTGSANGGSGLYGVYTSTDQGLNWTFRCCGPQPAGPPSISNPNLMGWSDDGTDDGGQYYYDLAFAVSPTNADSVFVGGVNLWISANRGNSFVCPAKWSHPDKTGYVHADIHDIHYYTHTHEIWLACDGGIFYSNDNGITFERRTVGIEGTDFWGFGQGWWHGDIMLGGAYHNGTMLKENDVYLNDWICTDGGDGTLGFVNPGLEKQVYSWFDIKELQSDRNVAPVTRTFQYKPNNSYITGKSSDLLVDPRYFTHWLTGNGTKLYKTKDNGYSFHEIHDFGEDVASMAQSWSDPDVIYVCTFSSWWGLKRIYRTTDGGNQWTEITPSSGMVNGNTWIPYDIEVDHNDPQKIWVARTSMYDSQINGFTLYYSNNGGDTWQNISGSGLNGHSPTSIYHQKGSDGGLYVGTRRGVFYKDNSLSDWTLFNNELPASTHSTRLEGYYRKNKIRNATNRSVWESTFYSESEPQAYPSAVTDSIFCAKDSVQFVDHSVVSDDNVTWSWSFPGGSPSTSDIRNPKVHYSSSGTYDVTLTVSDIHGTSTRTFTDFIIVADECAIDTVPGLALRAENSRKHGLVQNIGLEEVDSLTVTAWIYPLGTQPEYSGIFMGDGPSAAGLNFKNGLQLAYHWPGGQWGWNSNIFVPENQWSFVALVVTPSGITLHCNEQSATHQFTLTPTDIPSFRIGSYRNWTDRNMNGWIDEVGIYDRPLSAEEIRLRRHLTRYPDSDTSLIAYYQFNGSGSNDYDKVGTHHVLLTNNAQKTPSDAPVGGGKSMVIDIDSGGLKDFSDAGMQMYFPDTGIFPNGPVVVSQLNVDPNILPPTNFPSDKYWIINNYGSNSTFTRLDSLKIFDSGNIFGGCGIASYHLYQREENSHENTWIRKGNPVDYSPFPESEVIFHHEVQLIQDGQLYVANSGFHNPQITELCNGVDDNCNGEADEEVELIVTRVQDSGYGHLRNLLNCVTSGDTITFLAGIDTIYLDSPLLFDRDVHILGHDNNPVTCMLDMDASSFLQSDYGMKINDNTHVSFEWLNIHQQGNSETKPVVVNFGNWSLVNCNFSGSPHPVIVNENNATLHIEGQTVLE
jgi:PKD repeat protein